MILGETREINNVGNHKNRPRIRVSFLEGGGGLRRSVDPTE